VLQPRRNLHFVEELVVPGVGILLGYFQGHALFLDGVVGAVNVSERPGRDAADNPVFSDFLSGS
jgi:hypothetical protein